MSASYTKIPFPTADDPSQIADPIARFQRWWSEVQRHPDIPEPTAMTLATATREGMPSARVVLLKDATAEGFTWFTNADSRKGKELRSNPHAALCFYWMPLRRQVRVEGRVTAVTTDESDAYFASRARDSQIGAWASLQSRPLDTRETFEERIRSLTAEYEGRDVPRPDYWHGWRLIPQKIEFWTERPYRLHDREIYTATASGNWEMGRLYP